MPDPELDALFGKPAAPATVGTDPELDALFGKPAAPREEAPGFFTALGRAASAATRQSLAAIKSTVVHEGGTGSSSPGSIMAGGFAPADYAANRLAPEEVAKARETVVSTEKELRDLGKTNPIASTIGSMANPVALAPIAGMVAGAGKHEVGEQVGDEELAKGGTGDVFANAALAAVAPLMPGASTLVGKVVAKPLGKVVGKAVGSEAAGTVARVAVHSMGDALLFQEPMIAGQAFGTGDLSAYTDPMTAVRSRAGALVFAPVSALGHGVTARAEGRAARETVGEPAPEAVKPETPAETVEEPPMARQALDDVPPEEWHAQELAPETVEEPVKPAPVAAQETLDFSAPPEPMKPVAGAVAEPVKPAAEMVEEPSRQVSEPDLGPVSAEKAPETPSTLVPEPVQEAPKFEVPGRRATEIPPVFRNEDPADLVLVRGKAKNEVAKVEDVPGSSYAVLHNADGTFSVGAFVEGTGKAREHISAADRERPEVQPDGSVSGHREVMGVAIDGDAAKMATQLGDRWRGTRDEAIARATTLDPITKYGEKAAAATQATADLAAHRAGLIRDNVYQGKWVGEEPKELGGLYDAIDAAKGSEEPTASAYLAKLSPEELTTLHTYLEHDPQVSQSPITPRGDLTLGDAVRQAAVEKVGARRLREATLPGVSEAGMQDSHSALARPGSPGSQVPGVGAQPRTYELGPGHRVTISRGNTAAGEAGHVAFGQKDGKVQATITIGKNGDVGVLAHEMGHPVLRYLATNEERKILTSRFKADEVAKIQKEYADAGLPPLSEEQARDELALDRLRDAVNTGDATERGFIARLTDQVREAARLVNLSPGSEARLMEQLKNGEFWDRVATADNSRSTAVERFTAVRDAVHQAATANGPWALGWARAIGLGLRRFQDRVYRLRMSSAPEARALAGRMRTVQDNARAYLSAWGKQRAAVATRLANGLLSLSKVRDLNDLRVMSQSAADGPVSTKLWNILHRKQGLDGLTALQKDVVTAIQDAVVTTGDAAKELGLRISHTVPRVTGRDYRLVWTNTVPGLRDFVAKTIADANKLTVEEVIDHFAPMSDVTGKGPAVKLSPMERDRRFQNMPQAVKYRGRVYELYSSDPLHLIDSIYEDSAHRLAYIDEFGGGRESRAAVPEYEKLSREDQRLFDTWTDTWHGHELGVQPASMLDSLPWRMNLAARDVTDNVLAPAMRVMKSAALLGSTVGDIYGHAQVSSSMGTMAAVKGALRTVWSPRETYRAMARSGAVHSVAQSIADPNLLKLAGNTAESIIGAPKRWAAALSETMAWAAAQEALKAGMREADIRQLGLTAAEAGALAAGKADAALRTKFASLVVEKHAASRSIRGTGSAFSDYAVARVFGPAFASWADRQIQRRATLFDQLGRGDLRAIVPLAIDAVATAGAGAATVATMAWISGGSEGVKQQTDKDTWSQVKDYLVSGYGGGYLSAAVNLGEAGLDWNKIASAVSYPASVATGLSQKASKVADAWRNGEYMHAAFQAAVSAAPFVQRLHDGLMWGVEAQNPGALRQAVSEFHEWRKNNPTLSEAPGVGSPSDDPGAQIIRAVVEKIKEHGVEMTPGQRYTAVREAVQKAYALPDGVDTASLATRLLSARLFTRLKVPVEYRGSPEMKEYATEVAKLKVLHDLGPVAYQRLERYDALLESLAEALKQ